MGTNNKDDSIKSTNDNAEISAADGTYLTTTLLKSNVEGFSAGLKLMEANDMHENRRSTNNIAEISVADGTSNTGAVFVGADANEKIYSYYNSANHTSDIDSFKHFNKIVNTWDSSGVKIYINGFSRTVSGSQSLSSSDYDNLRVSRANGSLPFYGDVKQVMTFKTKLTDSELETLTKGSLNSFCINPISYKKALMPAGLFSSNISR